MRTQEEQAQYENLQWPDLKQGDQVKDHFGTWFDVMEAVEWSNTVSLYSCSRPTIHRGAIIAVKSS